MSPNVYWLFLLSFYFPSHISSILRQCRHSVCISPGFALSICVQRLPFTSDLFAKLCFVVQFQSHSHNDSNSLDCSVRKNIVPAKSMKLFVANQYGKLFCLTKAQTQKCEFFMFCKIVHCGFLQKRTQTWIEPWIKPRSRSQNANVD